MAGPDLLAALEAGHDWIDLEPKDPLVARWWRCDRCGIVWSEVDVPSRSGVVVVRRLFADEGDAIELTEAATSCK